MARRFFGTDGIRGSANSTPMTSEVALRVGMAANLEDALRDPACPQPFVESAGRIGGEDAQDGRPEAADHDTPCPVRREPASQPLPLSVVAALAAASFTSATRIVVRVAISFPCRRRVVI